MCSLCRGERGGMSSWRLGYPLLRMLLLLLLLHMLLLLLLLMVNKLHW